MSAPKKSYSDYFRWDGPYPSRSKLAPVHISYPEEYIETPALLLSDSEDDLSLHEEGAMHDENSLLHDEENKQVRFHTAQIRDYGVTIGDHPSCCDCLPLSLDWTHGEEQVYNIDEYETMRMKNGRSERGRLEPLDYWEKRQILEDSQPMDGNVINPEDPDTTTEGHCDPFKVFEGASWDMFSSGACAKYSYPAMTVQVLED